MAGTGVLFVSMEMSRLQLGMRVLSLVGRVDGYRIRGNYLSQDERRRIVDASGKMSAAPLVIDDASSRTVTQVAALARRQKRSKAGLGLVVVDYLQLVEPDNNRDSRQEQVARISRRFKGMSVDIGVPVLCIAQLNREADHGAKPKLSQLRESGAIEQDADVVLFIHNERDGSTGAVLETVLIIAKQRSGPIGEIPVVFSEKFTRFDEKAPERHNEFDEFNDRRDYQ
jgi:replicative DNA helicase